MGQVKKIGIIGAMDEEIALYMEALEDPKATKISSLDFYEGKLSGKDVVIVKSGLGKVNASVCTQILINLFNIEYIIFTGVAGALNPELEIKDIIISKDSIQHDVDGEALGYEKGRIVFTDLKAFKSSEELRGIAKDSAKKLELKVREGRVLTGDQFISDKKISKSLRDNFDGDCVDMEGAAVAHVCTLSDIPHLIIRSISDKADDSAELDFKEFCKDTSTELFSLVKEILFNIKIKEIETPIQTDRIRKLIRTIPHWPKQGVMFRDITTLLLDPDAFNDSIAIFIERYKDQKIDSIAGIESRGFIFGSVLASSLNKKFIPIRKKGKLPHKTLSQSYTKEYGQDILEIHADAIGKGEKVLIIDDLVATGGTALAAAKLVEKTGANVVEIAFLIGLKDLVSDELKKKYKIFSAIEYEGE